MEFDGPPYAVVNGGCSATALYLQKKVAICLLSMLAGEVVQKDGKLENRKRRERGWF